MVFIEYCHESDSSACVTDIINNRIKNVKWRQNYVIDEVCESGNILPKRGCQNCLARYYESCTTCDIIFIIQLIICDDDNLIYDSYLYQLYQRSMLFVIRRARLCLREISINYRIKYEHNTKYMQFQTYYSYFLIFIQQNQTYHQFICTFAQKDMDQLQISKSQDNQEYAYYDINENRFKLPSYYFKQKQKCVQGYYLNNSSKFISQFGDQILFNDEECEANNENCINCYLKNLCLEYEVGYYI